MRLGRRVWNRILVGLGLSIIALIFYVAIRLIAIGALEEVRAKAPISSWRIAEVPGPEDMEWDDRGERLYISSQDRHAARRGGPSNGAIYRLSLEEGSTPFQIFPTNETEPMVFNPHGLSLFRDASGQLFLAVINHRTNQDHTIEVLVEDGQSGFWSKQATLRHSALVSPNDLVMVAESEFFVTNDSTWGHAWRRKASIFLDLPNGNLIHLKEGRKIDSVPGLNFPNGIIKHGGEILIAETTGRRLLNRRGEAVDLSLPFGTDNLSSNGKMVVAAVVPNLLALGRHQMNPVRFPSPVRIVARNFDQGENSGWTTLFEDDGTTASGVTSAVVAKDMLLLGTVMESKILACRLSDLEGYDQF